MKKLFLILLFSMTLTFSCQPRKDIAAAKKLDQAINAGNAWLELADSKEYAKTYQTAADVFKNAVTEEKWVSDISGVIEPLGKLNNRSFLNAEFFDSYLADLFPEGECVVLRYKASYENKDEVIETLTLQFDEKDSLWKVAGTTLSQWKINWDDELFKIVSSENVSYDLRRRAVEKLKELPSDEALIKIFPEYIKISEKLKPYGYMPPDSENIRPLFQVFHAVHDVWNYHLRTGSQEIIIDALLKLLENAETNLGKIHIINELIWNWNASVEEPLYGILINESESISARNAAARGLLKNTGIKYHVIIIEIINKSESSEEKYRFWETLVKNSPPKSSCAEILQIGFDMMENGHKASYFIAGAIGRYLNLKFVKLEEYRTDTGLAKEYFDDMVTNALKWWSENKEKYAKGLND